MLIGSVAVVAEEVMSLLPGTSGNELCCSCELALTEPALELAALWGALGAPVAKSWTADPREYSDTNDRRSPVLLEAVEGGFRVRLDVVVRL